MRAKLRCVRCGAEYDVQPKMFSCPKCGGLLEVVIEPEELPPFSEFTKRSRMKGYGGSRSSSRSRAVPQ